MTNKIFLMLGIIAVLPLQARYDYRYTTAGQWEIMETNYGPFGGNGFSSYGGYWPRSSGHNYIYGSGIWIGGILPNGDTVVTLGYDPHNGGSEFSPGLPGTDPADTLWRVYYSTDDYYPLFPRTMEDGYAIFNDFDTLRHLPDSVHRPEPLGIKVSQYTSVWAKDWADDVLFIKYIVKNDTTYPILNAYLGFCLDFDIGNESGTGNDRCGCDLPRKLFYGWQEQDEPGWNDRGMIGLKFLSALPIAAFKRFTLNFEPKWDRQRYLVLAGYNYTNGMYEPYDTTWPAPDDQRILMSAGPFDLAPGDSVIMDWALIASHDYIPPSPDMELKADRAQHYFATDTVHRVQVNHPADGETVSGLYRVEYHTIPATANPLYADIFFRSENHVDTIAQGILNSGLFEWLSDSVPDCLFARMGVLVYDTITFGYSRSGGYFMVNNAGNSSPYLHVFQPNSMDTLTGAADVKWFARDPEFLDSLPISIYFKPYMDTVFQVLASNELNDSSFSWYTRPFRNGPAWIIVETHDEEFSVAETIQVVLSNRVSGGNVEYLQGLNNTVNLSVLIHQPSYVTDHTYELRFKEYGALHRTTIFPEYFYDVIDSNTGEYLLTNYSLRNGYSFGTLSIGINDFTPIVDGFSIYSWTQSDTVISRNHFQNDSIQIMIGSYPTDSIAVNYFSYVWWAYRGSHIQLDWMIKTGGGLTLRVTDLDYGDTIPFKMYSVNSMQDSAAGWCFRSYTVGSYLTSSDTLRDTDQYILLCGTIIRFSRSVPPPQPGDRWIVYPKPWAPPIKGNVYRFHPVNFVAENDNAQKSVAFQVYPIPMIKNLRIAYGVIKPQEIKLMIYDALGRIVKILKKGRENTGVYSVVWDGRDMNGRRVSSGVYFCRFESRETAATKKFILLR